MGMEEPFKVSRQVLSRDINEVLGNATEGKATSHTFRSSFITLVGKEMGIIEASQLVGHKNIETTNRYMLSLVTKEGRKKVRDEVLMRNIRKGVYGEIDGGLTKT